MHTILTSPEVAWPRYFNERRHLHYRTSSLGKDGVLLELYMQDALLESVLLQSNQYNTIALSWREPNDNVVFFQNIAIGRAFDVSKSEAQFVERTLKIKIPLSNSTPHTITIKKSHE